MSSKTSGFAVRPLVQAAVCAAFLLWHGSLALRAADWPQWRGANRDGVWRESGGAGSFPAEGLKISWRVPVGRGWSSPVVAKGRVYVTDLELAPPMAWERLRCFEETTGRQLWQHRYAAKYPDWAFAPDAGGPRATPCVQDGKVFTLGALGALLCLDATDGHIIWQRDLAKDYQVPEFSGITGSPLIEGDLLILNIYGKPAASVVALAKSTGEERWRALNDTFSYSTPAVLSAGGQRQLIVWSQEGVTSLDPRTGQVWWREMVRTPGDMAVATPVFQQNLLYVGGLMFQLDPQTPKATVLWPESRAATRRVLSNTSTPLLSGDQLYSARTTGQLVGLEAASGRVLWETNTVTSLKNGACIHLTQAGDSVLLFTDQGNVIRARLSAAGYEELGRAHVLEPTHPFNGRDVIWPPPAYANGHIVARNDRELVRAALTTASVP